MGCKQQQHMSLTGACPTVMLLVLLLVLPTASGAPKPPTTPTQHRGVSYTAEAERDRVGFLPGGPAQLDFGLFSGYITVDESAGRALFYVFAEARTADPTKAPLLLWLNGGPGCSSLGGGFLSELGPFYPTVSGTGLQPNPYSWNNLTNVIWLESPAFVGFSYSNSSDDQIVGDARTAADARLFLLHWMKRFPQYAHADLYLSGESYGGHYVPNLALEIVRGNKRAPSHPTAPAAAPAAAASAEAAAASDGAAARKGSKDGSTPSSSSSGSSDVVPGDSSSSSSSGSSEVSPGKGHLNLKGFFVGNAWTDAAIDNKGALDFWYSHAMVSAEAQRAITDNCDFSNIGPLMRGSSAVTLPGTHRRGDTPRPSSVAAAAAGGAAAAAPMESKTAAVAAVGSSTGSSSSASSSSASSSSSSSGLGHAGVSQSWWGYGSSITTRFWESLGVSGFSRDDDKDMVCARWLDIAQAELGNINIYEIYADVCVQPPPPSTDKAGSSSSSSNSGNRVSSSSSNSGSSSSTGSSSASSSSSLSLSAGSRGYRGALLGWVHPRRRVTGGTGEDPEAGQGDGMSGLPRKPRYDPCIDGEVETYFNLPAVQEALHANQTVKLPWRWTDCTQLISYSREDLLSSMLPVYRELLDTDPALKKWVFSGDVDGIVPVLGSRHWIESLQLPINKPWRAWTSRTGQVGGWRIDYQGLTFATVRNSGHMVPYVTPERAYSLLGEFLHGSSSSEGGSSASSGSSDGGSSDGSSAAAGKISEVL